MKYIVISEEINNWLKKGDRGASSESIVEVLTGLNITGKFGLRHPSDPSDFFRCVKLLMYVPSFKSRLKEMSKISLQWEVLVDNWDELERLLYLEIDTGSCPILYSRMIELIKQTGE